MSAQWRRRCCRHHSNHKQGEGTPGGECNGRRASGGLGGCSTTSLEPKLRAVCPAKPWLLLSDFSAILGCGPDSRLKDGFLHRLSLPGGSQKESCHSSLSDLTQRHVQVSSLAGQNMMSDWEPAGLTSQKKLGSI